MMKSTFYTLFFSCFAWNLSAQSAVNIFPNPAGPAQCANNEVIYYIFPWSFQCPETVKVLGGEVVKRAIYDAKLHITVIWQMPIDGTPARIELTWGDSTCGNGTFSQAWDFSIIAEPTSAPVVTASSQSYYMGLGTTIALEASLGVSTDTSANALTITPYEWEAPADWFFFGISTKKKSLRIPVNDTLQEGCIRVRGKYPCGRWSDWTELCLKGRLTAPCPLRLANGFVLCGDTTETSLASPNFKPPFIYNYDWSPPEYSWTVPPGWTITSNNPDTANYVMIKPDGHTDGVFSVFATTNGMVTETCLSTATILPANPNTIVLGPDYLCQSADYQLNISPPPHSEINWRVDPVDAATPQVFFPNQGSGTANLQISDPGVSGYFRIIYTVSNTCGSTSFRKDFFVGKPSFSNTTIDGALYNAQSLCTGSHGIKTEVQGTDAPIIWSPSSGITGYVKRDSFVFFLTPAEQANCPAITITATNNCGFSDLDLAFCPQIGCSSPSLDLLVYPNPAYLIVSLEVTSRDPLAEDYALIGQVEIFNHLGQLVRVWNESPSRRIVKAIADLPQGIYTLRATVWDQIIIKPLVLVH